MTRSVLALPFTALRTGRKLATRFTWPVIAGAAALVYRKVHRPEPRNPAGLDAFPGDGPAKQAATKQSATKQSATKQSATKQAATKQAATKQAAAKRPVAVPRPDAEPTPREPVATEREPEVVIESVPLAEPAVDLDPDVTLPSELPIRAYDALSAKDAVAAIRELTEPAEVRTVLEFETENGKRTTVLSAARSHLAALERSVRS